MSLRKLLSGQTGQDLALKLVPCGCFAAEELPSVTIHECATW